MPIQIDGYTPFEEFFEDHLDSIRHVDDFLKVRDYASIRDAKIDIAPFSELTPLIKSSLQRVLRSAVHYPNPKYTDLTRMKILAGIGHNAGLSEARELSRALFKMKPNVEDIPEDRLFVTKDGTAFDTNDLPAIFAKKKCFYNPVTQREFSEDEIEELKTFEISSHPIFKALIDPDEHRRQLKQLARTVPPEYKTKLYEIRDALRHPENLNLDLLSNDALNTLSLEHPFQQNLDEVLGRLKTCGSPERYERYFDDLINFLNTI